MSIFTASNFAIPQTYKATYGPEFSSRLQLLILLRNSLKRIRQSQISLGLQLIKYSCFWLHKYGLLWCNT